jgi:hypothetical protein
MPALATGGGDNAETVIGIDYEYTFGRELARLSALNAG